MEVLTVKDGALTHQEGLNNVLYNKVNRMLENKMTSVQQTIDKIEADGKMLTDYIKPIGVNLKATGAKPEVTFSANGVVSMDFMAKVAEDSYEDNHFTLHDNAVGQLAARMGVPTRYLRDLAGGKAQWQRDLAARILNQHCENTERSRMLIRCVGNQVRGVLSDSYKRINSIDILVAFLQEALASDAVIADALYTETKMYVETILPTPVEIPTAKNGTVVLFAGARFSTSDFGDGALEMKSFLLNGACLNGMVRETQMRKVHIGGRLNDNLLLSQQTYDLDTKANCSAVRDITKYLYDRNTILAKAMEIEAAAEVEVDASKELKALAKAGHLYKQESEEIEKLMIQSRPDDGCQGQSTLWKLTQAITAHARDCEPRRQRELHEISGQLLSKATRK